ncbi:MAG: N-acetylmuramoyl-L-alanine amidase [Alphaproteobacteria bacterium]|nr:N-acetylmuramoyl-L-alanine amidase [Alphaproteobacteria bacterium]MDP6518168.1 N-acetylmuramoyl-L-alanine amidase [Alphaproteobacteria bacterium]
MVILSEMRNGALSSLAFVERPSPNNDPRSPGRKIDMLVLHYTGMADTDAALDRLCDPDSEVSAHLLIDEAGTVHRLVPEARRSWHAGVSAWAGETEINDLSIGIELANPGHELGYRAFPEAQMAALEIIARDIVVRHRIPGRRVLAHSDVAPARKQDPGELFDWPRLARYGIGLWPEYELAAPDGAALRPGDDGRIVAATQAALAAFGYELAPNGVYDPATEAVVTAFQRHFRPTRVHGVFDVGTAAALKALLDMVN